MYEDIGGVGLYRTPAVMFRKCTDVFRVCNKDYSTSLPFKEREGLFHFSNSDCERGDMKVAFKTSSEKQLHLQPGVSKPFCFPTQKESKDGEKQPATECI